MEPFKQRNPKKLWNPPFVSFDEGDNLGFLANRNQNVAGIFKRITMLFDQFFCLQVSTLIT